MERPDVSSGDFAPDLMPLPVSVERGQGTLRLPAVVLYQVSGRGSIQATERARPALDMLEQRTGRMVRCTPMLKGQIASALRMHCQACGSEFPELFEDESYTLVVDARRGIDLTASHPTGIQRGLATLVQLVSAIAGAWAVPACVIEDGPRFAWRGLMIDVARHFIPVPVIERTLDAMAAVKFNVLHLHLSDDQGFRVESREFPELSRLGGQDRYYTHDEIRALVQRAAARGIRIVPEFDLPGHASSWLAAYPHLGCRRRGYAVARDWGEHEGCLDPVSDATYEFLEGFFAEILPLFPDEFVHLGGDQVSGAEWAADPGVLEFVRTRGMVDHRDLQAYFTLRVAELAARHDKRIVGWQEIAHPDVGHEIVVQTWRDLDAMSEMPRQGYVCIQSHGYYLDLMQPAGDHYLVDPLDGLADLAEEDRDRVLGGEEACMWTEYVDDRNLESRLWPRAAAIAERLWSVIDVRDTADMYRRLLGIGRRLETLGSTHVIYLRRRLQEIADGREYGSLAQLAAVLAPPALSLGASTRITNRFTPLDRLVDAIPPESARAREFDLAVTTFLLGADHEAAAAAVDVRRHLDQWLANHVRFHREFRDTEIWNEFLPLSAALAELAAIGLTALNLPPVASLEPAALEHALTRLADFDEPHADLQLQVVAPVRRLLQAVAQPL